MKSLRTRILAMASVVAVSGLMMASVAGAADKLIVKDAAGTTDVFKVTDNGTISTAGFYYDGVTKYVGMGTMTPTGALSVTAQSGDANRGLVVSQHTSNAASAVAAFRKSRGTEGAGATTVVSGDYIGTFMFKNYDGTGWVRNAGFGARVNGTITTGSVPTEIFFWSNPLDTADAYGSGSVRMMISATGNMGIGTVTPTSKLQVVGLPVYADNAAALAGNLTAGAFYRTSTGVLMVVY